MKIEKVVLEHYKRLMLSNIRYFEWTPRSKIMLLLGSNGSGKSSILEELTPCPAHHSQFETGGVKEFHCTHNNHHYVLRSEYNGGSGRHSFIKDGHEELNPGATFAVQKDLVWSIFGLDRPTHEVLIGLTPFTSMPTAKRREWLTRLSPVDLSYAFSQYNTITSAKRDAQGVIKHKVKRMSQENFDLPSDAEMTALRDKVNHLTGHLHTLYKARGNAPISNVINIDYAKRLQGIESKAKNILGTAPAPSVLIGIKTKDDAMRLLYTAEQQLNQINAEIQRLGEELDILRSQKTPELEIESPEKIREIYRTHDNLKKQIEELTPKVSSYTGIFSLVEHPCHRQSVAILKEYTQSLTDLMSRMPHNEDGQYSKAKDQEFRERAKVLSSEILSLKERHSIACQRLARLKGCDDVVCPNCTHSFKPGVSPSDIPALEVTCEKLADGITKREKELAYLEEQLEAFKDYMVYVNEYRTITRQYDLYAVVSNELAFKKYIFTTPKQYITDVLKWSATQEDYINLRLAQEEEATLGTQIRRYEAFDSDKANYLTKQQTQLEQRIEGLYGDRQAVDTKIREIKSAIRSVEIHENSLREVQADLKACISDAAKHIQDLVHKGFDEEIRHTSTELAETQSKLHRSEMREHVLRDIELEHKEAVQWHDDLAILEKAMSPKDGLIGKYLMGFMQNIVKLMNAIIAEVWTYPLEVLPSKVDKDELDYNFPLSVNNGAVNPPDISRGSSSQRDIVNFAFKLIVMKFLGFDDYPLYLDEFGNTFDEQHRQNLIPMLNRLVEMNQVSQIIYISHFSSSHGSLSHPEVVVLDETNITTPNTYNTTVCFERPKKQAVA